MCVIINIMLQSVCSDELLLLYALHMSCRIQYQHDQMNFTYNVCYMFSDNAYKSSGITLNFLCRLDMMFSYKLRPICTFKNSLHEIKNVIYKCVCPYHNISVYLYSKKHHKISFIIIVIFVIYFASYLFSQ